MEQSTHLKKGFFRKIGDTISSAVNGPANPNDWYKNNIKTGDEVKSGAERPKANVNVKVESAVKTTGEDVQIVQMNQMNMAIKPPADKEFEVMIKGNPGDPFEALEEGSNETLKKFIALSGDLTLEGQLERMIDLLRENKLLRKIFPSLSLADSKMFYDFYLQTYFLARENMFNNLNENDPESLLILRNKLVHHPAVRETMEAVRKFEKRCKNMVKAAVGTIKTVQGVDNFFDLHNGVKYYPFTLEEMDEASKDFTKFFWTNALHDQAVEIADKNFEVCLPLPIKKEEATNAYKRMVDASLIMGRRIMTTKVRNRLLGMYKPVLTSLIEYFHSHSTNDLQIAKYHVDSLHIWRDLYEAGNAEIINDSGSNNDVHQQPVDEATNNIPTDVNEEISVTADENHAPTENMPVESEITNTQPVDREGVLNKFEEKAKEGEEITGEGKLAAIKKYQEEYKKASSNK